MAPVPRSPRRPTALRLAAGILVSATAVVGMSAAPASAAPGDHDYFGQRAVVTFETVWSGSQDTELRVRSVRVTEDDGSTACLDLVRDKGGLPAKSAYLHVGIDVSVRSYSRPQCVEGRYMAGSVGTITPYDQTWREPDGTETWMVHPGTVPSWVRG